MLVGIKGLGAEICKNLVLSGVKSVTIVDPDPVNEEDFVSQFLVQRQDLGKNVSVLGPGFRFFSFKRYCSFVSIWIGLCLMPMLWFNFIFGLSLIFLCFRLIIIHYHTSKQREIKFEPRIKLNHNIFVTGQN